MSGDDKLAADIARQIVTLDDKLSSMERQVDAMPLDAFLFGIAKSITYFRENDLDTKPLMKQFVTGMHKRGLMHHWEDCPIECLGDLITEQQGILIGQITQELICDEMFTLSMQLINEHHDAQVELEKRSSVEVERQRHACVCNIKDLATWGCKCGGV
jgi:hypothetical protein